MAIRSFSDKKKWYRGCSVSVFHRLNLIKQTTRTYCVQCKKKTENLNPKTFKTKNGRITMQSKRAVCGIKNSRFVKDQVAKGLLSNLGIKTSLNKIPLIGDILF